MEWFDHKDILMMIKSFARKRSAVSGAEDRIFVESYFVWLYANGILTTSHFT